MERFVTVTGNELRDFLERWQHRIYKSRVTVWTHGGGKGLPGSNPVEQTINWFDKDTPNNRRLETRYELYVNTETLSPRRTVVHIRPARDTNEV